MSWEDELRIEKGIMDNIKFFIKTMKTNTFEDKLKKFLKKELIVKYKYDKESSGGDWDASVYQRETPREQSIEEAKNVLLEKVEEVFDEIFPESYTKYPTHDYSYSDEY